MNEQSTVEFSSGDLKATNQPRVRSGVIFKAAKYPDKGANITEANLKTIVANFTGPIPVDVEHCQSIFCGKLGAFSKIWQDGNLLFGEWIEPANLTALLGDAARRVSVALNVTKMQLERVSLVLAPRVAEAIVFSADADNAIDWAEVARARKEAGLPPRK